MVDITPLIPKGRQIISGYGNGGFNISGQKYQGSVIVMPDRVIGWSTACRPALVAGYGATTPDPVIRRGDIGFSGSDFTKIVENKDKIEILLVGTGKKFELLPAEIARLLKSNGIAVESMDTGAACRTYNVLLSEERKVAAALVAV